MGYIVNEQCLPDAATAQDAFFSAMPPTVTAGSTSYEVRYTKSGAVWYQQGYAISNKGVYTLSYSVPATAPAFAACDPAAHYLDGITIGWGIAAAMVAAKAVNLMRKGI